MNSNDLSMDMMNLTIGHHFPEIYVTVPQANSHFTKFTVSCTWVKWSNTAQSLFKYDSHISQKTAKSSPANTLLRFSHKFGQTHLFNTVFNTQQRKTVRFCDSFQASVQNVTALSVCSPKYMK